MARTVTKVQREQPSAPDWTLYLSNGCKIGGVVLTETEIRSHLTNPDERIALLSGALVNPRHITMAVPGVPGE